MLGSVRGVPGNRHSYRDPLLSRGDTLIYGGRISADGLLGEPDLLRWTQGGYVAGDIKSGAGVEGASEDTDGKPKKHYAVQLALYTDILERMGFSGGELYPNPANLHLLGQ